MALPRYFPFTSIFNFRNHLTLRDLDAKSAFREGRFLVAARYTGIEDRRTRRNPPGLLAVNRY
jgi:hypothetical protein